MDVQFCPKCKSDKVITPTLSYLGDPFKIQGHLGWECAKCGYIGKDFFIVSKEEYKKIKSLSQE